ncbi:MAG: tandem-95 repeat protein [Planctomycetes bacterium]|nr:tandem-95 repeat protein [Planctomycetota bacterium]
MSARKRPATTRLSVEPLEERRLLSVMSFQDGVFPTTEYEGTRDAPVLESEPDVNFGDDDQLWADGEVGTTGFAVWSLLKWDLSRLPAEATINDISLTINATDPTSAPGYPLLEMKTPWIESQVTWNGPDADSTWEEPGLLDPIDVGATALGTVTPTGTGRITILLNSAGRATVKRWIEAPETNHGFLLANPDNRSGMKFNSREAANAVNRPRLTVDFNFTDVDSPTATLVDPLDGGPADQDDDLGKVRVGIHGRFQIELDDFALDDATVTAEAVNVTLDGATFSDFSFSYNARTQTITLTPPGDNFAPGRYEIILSDTAQIADQSGNAMPRTVLAVHLDPLIPVTRDDAYEAVEDTPLVVDVGNGLLKNDLTGAVPTTAVLFDGPENGIVAIMSDGSFTYEPVENFFGTDTFRYRAAAGAFESNIATVQITVAPVNDAPSAADDVYVVNIGETLGSAGGMPPGVSLIEWPVNGHFYGVVRESGNWKVLRDRAETLTFRGTKGYLVTITNRDENAFLVQNVLTSVPVNTLVPIGLTDEQVEGDFRWITGEPLTFTNWNPGEPNNAGNEDYVELHFPDGNRGWIWVDTSLSQGFPRYIVEFEPRPLVNVLDNDSDPDGDTLRAVLVNDVDNGTLTLTDSGSFTYVPNPGFVGVDSFAYAAGDGQLISNVATVTIKVNGAPVATDNAYEVDEGGVLTVDAAGGVLNDDSDPNGDVLFAVLVSEPSSGTLELGGDGSFIYTPEENFVGIDAFSYRADDGHAQSDPATVTIDVLGLAPVVKGNTYTSLEDETLTVDAAAGVLANDSDPQGDEITAVLVRDVREGTLTLNPDGSFVYQPNENFAGLDTFRYRASDGEHESASTLVQITIENVNDPPVAVDDEYVVGANQTLIPPADVGRYEDIIRDSDPSGYWRFSETVGESVVVDSSGNERHGTYRGDVLLEQPDAIGNPNSGAVKFDRGPDHITLPHDLVNGATNLTAEFWFQTQSTGKQTIISGALNSFRRDNEYLIEFQTDTRLVYVNSFIASVTWTIPTISGGQWHHYVIVRNDASDVVELFIDGQSRGQQSIQLSAVSLSPGGLVIGEDQDYTGTIGTGFDPAQALDGLLDELAFYPRVLSAQEIQRHFLAAQFGGVLDNDLDVDGDTLKALLVNDVDDGTLTFTDRGSFTYVPNPGFVGVDSFTYVASDGQSASNVATVTIRVGLEEVPADLTGNGFVDFEDLTVLLAAWNQDVSAAEGNLVDADGTPVNFEDLTVLLAAWTGPGPAGAPVGRGLAAAVGGDFGGAGESVAVGDASYRQSVAVGDASYRRGGEAPRRGAGNGSATGVASYRERRGALGRLQAVAVDAVLAEEGSLRRARIQAAHELRRQSQP